VLLTTPESLEAMLVSRTIDAPRMFADLHVVVVIDEVHAFAVTTEAGTCSPSLIGCRRWPDGHCSGWAFGHRW
jgi:hypothetical protein